MAWPHLAESWCPWCERTIAQPRMTRFHDDGAEYQCPHCSQTHVRKEGIEDAVFFFFPADIAACTSKRIESPFEDWEV